jgi:hypothetical protein
VAGRHLARTGRRVAIRPDQPVSGWRQEGRLRFDHRPSPHREDDIDAEQKRERLEGIVRRFAEIAPEGWVRLVGNWEATQKPGGATVLNYLTLAVVDGGDRWLFGQIGYDEPLYDLVTGLNDAVAQSEGDERRWTVLDLEVDADAAFRVQFGYDTPKRSNGIQDEESLGRFQDYLETWIAEHGPVPSGGRPGGR